MDVIWAHDEICVREVMQALNRRGAARAYTTYMTIMARLDTKGLLIRTRRGKTDYYRAVYTREHYADLRAGAAIDAIVEQFGEVALSHLAARSRSWIRPTVDRSRALPVGGDIRHRHVFGLAAALGVGGLGLTAATIITTVASVHRASAGARQIVLAGIRFTYPTVNGPEVLLFVLGMSAAAVIATAVRAGWRQISAHRRLTAALEPVEFLDRDPRVGVIRDPRPQAFCAGYLRPAVYISRRTVELLGDSELDAVLAHEHHHRRVRDPLKIACGRVLSEAIFFVPILKPLCDGYADLAELSADRAAVRASAGREAPLASALLAFDKHAPPGTSGISPERVDSLLGQPTPWRVPAWLLAGSVTALAALTVVIWLISESAHAHATFNLPIVSSRPCLVIMSIVPAAGCLRVLTQLVRSRDTDRRKPTAQAAPSRN